MNISFAPPMCKKTSIWIATCLMLMFFLPQTGMTAEGGWQEAGVRMGIQSGPKHEYFHQYEAFAVYGLPWDWRTSSGWGLALQLSASAGTLIGGDETGLIGSIGPGLAFNKPGNGFAVEVGINGDLLDRRHFGGQDFGSILLFGAYMGLSYRFMDGPGISYRIQHLSNGHIFYPKGTPNPGVDMHLIGVSWNF